MKKPEPKQSVGCNCVIFIKTRPPPPKVNTNNINLRIRVCFWVELESGVGIHQLRRPLVILLLNIPPVQYKIYVTKNDPVLNQIILEHAVISNLWFLVSRHEVQLYYFSLTKPTSFSTKIMPQFDSKLYKFREWKLLDYNWIDRLLISLIWVISYLL